jgi:hypothetical protein
MLTLNLLIDGMNTVADFELNRDNLIDVIMIDGIPAGVLPVTYINEVKSKILEAMK